MQEISKVLMMHRNEVLTHHTIRKILEEIYLDDTVSYIPDMNAVWRQI